MAETSAEYPVRDGEAHAGPGGLSLRQLECFYAVAETLHFGNAAKRLHLSQPSVSEAVTALELAVGQPLLLRSTRRVQLTQFGVEFMQQTKPAYDSLVTAYYSKLSSSHPAPLRIAHTPELGRSVFPSLLPRLEAEYFGTSTREQWLPVMLHTNSQLTAVADGRVDIGICWQPNIIAGLEKTVLAKCPYVAILRDDDALARQESLTLADLSGRRIVVASTVHNKPASARLRWAMNQAGLLPSAFEEPGEYDEIVFHVAASGSVGVNPATSVLLDSPPGIVFRFLEDPGLYLDICAVTRMRTADDRIHRFTKILGESAADAVCRALESLETGGHPQ
jgi:DNA-binding transcriptional LysR family regulator